MAVKRQHPDLLDALTKRELEILSLMKDGLSNAQIAVRLVLSAETVKWYIKEIYSKLGVSSRTQALKWADELGLLATTTETGVSRSGAPRHNLPAALTPFVGRHRELETLSGLIRQPGTRLVTILGLGGMGKTRLALTVAASTLSAFTDGVFFVPLAPLTSPDELIPAIADALHFTFSPDSRTPRQQLLDYLRHKQLLLLLDNFEHLLNDTSLITDILLSAPQVSMVVTSRERLEVRGEKVNHLQGLDVPESSNTEHMFEFSAVQLFVQSALHVQSDFVAEAADVVGICRLVQGMPLAIELAAAWVGALSLPEIIQEIQQSADFLRTTMRDVPERLRSVRTVFEMAWSRLSADEQRVLRRLSVFRGGCSRAAATAITEATPGLLAALVNRALVWLRPQSERYEVHELLRQYAQERLEEAGEAEQVRDTHQNYFAQFADEWAQALKTASELTALAKLDADVDNIRYALRRAIDQASPEALEPFTDYWYYYDIRGLWDEGQKLFGEAIARLQPHKNATLGKLMIGRTIFLERLQIDEWERLARTSLDVLRRFDVVDDIPLAMVYVGIPFMRAGAHEEARTIFQAGVEFAQAHNNLWCASILYFHLGVIAQQAGDFNVSKAFFRQAYELMRKLSNIWGLSWIALGQADLAFTLKDYKEAQRLYEEGLTQGRRIGHILVIEAALLGLSILAWQRGDYVTATDLAEAMVSIRRTTGRDKAVTGGLIWLAEIALSAGDRPKAQQRLVEARAQIGDTDIVLGLFFLLIVADLWMQAGQPVPAIELLSVIEHHPIIMNHEENQWARVSDQKLSALLDQGRSELTLQAFDAAYGRGKTLSFDRAMAELHQV